MKKWILFLFLLPAFAFAEPYLAIREGLKCSSCHANKTGGGKRTKMGAGYGTQALPWIKVDLRDKKVPTYWSVLDDRLSFGGDFRFLNQSIFEKDNISNTFQTDKANLYLDVQALPEMLDFYLDESVAPGGAQSREIFGIFTAMPAHGWIKAGKFIQPYGIRLEDDNAFIRQVTGFNFANPDLGAEIGFEPRNWSFVAAVTNGTAGSADNNTGKQVVGNVTFVQDAFRIGVSGSYNPSPQGNKNSGALWAGLRIKKAVLLGEADIIHEDVDPTHSRNQMVAYSELDYPIIEGWNFKIGYEYFDPDTGIAENQRDRVLIGVEPFIVPFLQMSVFYRFNQSIPQNKAQNADELTFRIHIYF